ncbi:hypothetical protein BS17DRAFT_645726, partial [Gyrodon lividus]
LQKMLHFFSSAPFYTTYGQLPTTETPISQQITVDQSFHYFHDCIRAVDGMHIHAFVLFEEHVHMQNRK